MGHLLRTIFGLPRSLDERGIVIDPDYLDRCCPLDNGRHDNIPTSETSTVELGVLGEVPPELWSMILLDLDMQTLTKFRSVSRYTRRIVDALPEYQAIFTGTPYVLRAVISTRIGSWISCRTLYTALCDPACVCCGKFGTYLYLLTCDRVCYNCFSLRRHYEALTWKEAQARFGLDRTVLSTLPTVYSLPGSYSEARTCKHERLPLVDKEMAMIAGIELHGSMEKMHDYAWWQWLCGNPGRGPRIPGPRQFAHSQEFHVAAGRCRFRSDPHRYMSVIRAPLLGALKGTLSGRLSCDGHANDWNRPVARITNEGGVRMVS